METNITQDDLDKIKAGIHEKYSKVAKTPEGEFEYPTGRKGLMELNYDGTLIKKLPDVVASSYCGVGNPFSLGNINEGDQVLDVGCGAGVDSLLAGIMVGPSGSAVGVDIVPEMIDRAEQNLKMVDIDNVSFQRATGENIPCPDNSFNVVISNGVINLIPDKESVMSEIMRVLKPGGRLMMADQVAADDVKKDIRERIGNWFQ